MRRKVIFSLLGAAVIVLGIIAVVKSGVFSTNSNEKSVEKALDEVVQQMDALAVRISCSHEAVGNTNGTEAESYSKDSAVVDFDDEEAHLSQG